MAYPPLFRKLGIAHLKSTPLHTGKQSIQQLFENLRQGSREAYCEIFKIYYNKLFRYGKIILKDPQIVEDTIQDVFIWVLENPEKIKHIGNFEVYLFSSMKRNLRERIKQRNRSKKIVQKIFQDDHFNHFQESIEQNYIRKEVLESNRNWINKQLAVLPSRQREVIYLRYYEGLSYDEIAEIVSVSNQVARNYAARALRSLRKIAAKSFVFLIICLS